MYPKREPLLIFIN